MLFQKLKMQNNFQQFEILINYIFKDKKLINTAFIHPSYANEHNLEKYMTNQRLEFLGDSVLQVVSSNFLYEKYPNFDEGKLTKIRSKLVCENNLSEVARKLYLYENILLGNGENKYKVKNNNSIMCDTIEAVIGAIYLDGGIDVASNFIKEFILTEDNLNKANTDYKSIVQEFANKINQKIEYRLDDEVGPAHDKEFFVSLLFNNVVYGSGSGKTKKDAEQNAAKSAFVKFLEDNNVFKAN